MDIARQKGFADIIEILLQEEVIDVFWKCGHSVDRQTLKVVKRPVDIYVFNTL